MSYKNLSRRKWRTFLTVFSLTAAILGFVCTVNISESVGFVLTSGEAERALFSGIDVGYPYFCDILITAKHPWWYDIDPIGEPFRGPEFLVSESILADIKTNQGVEWVEPYIGDLRIYAQATIRRENGSIKDFSSNIMFVGVDPVVETRRLGRNLLIYRGRAPKELSQEIMVGFNIAKLYNLSIGDTLNIPAESRGTHISTGSLKESTQFTGLLYTFLNLFEEHVSKESFQITTTKDFSMKIVGIFWTSTTLDDYVVADYKELAEVVGFFNKVTCIFVKLKSDTNLDQTLNAFWSLQDVNVYIPILKKQYSTGAAQGGSTFSGVASTRFAKISNLQNVIASEIATIAFIAGVVYTTVYERRWEIGLLKALGFENSFIFSIILGEAIILGLVAGIIGFVASTILSLLSIGISLPVIGFIPLLSQVIPGIELKLTFEWGAIAIGISIATSLISSLIPAYMATKLLPIEAMRRG